MKNNNQIYEAIRNLICLLFYLRNNLQSSYPYLGMYKFKENEYELYYFGQLIFIKCANDSFLITVKDDIRCEGLNVIEHVTVLQVGRYKNIDINDIEILDQNFGISKKNTVYRNAIELYNHNGNIPLYINNNKYTDKFEENRYTFNLTDYFDNYLKKQNYLPNMKDVFSPEIILNLIEQVYCNMNNIYINNRLEGIISSLTPEELKLLKEKIKGQDTKLSQNTNENKLAKLKKI